jgi:hypothetical protein
VTGRFGFDVGISMRLSTSKCPEAL